jgi:hypothetical protein
MLNTRDNAPELITTDIQLKGILIGMTSLAERFLCPIKSGEQRQDDAGLCRDDIIEHPWGAQEVRLSIMPLHNSAQDISITTGTKATERV